MILLVGFDLFAISPLDERGEPNPRFLWSNPVQIHGTTLLPKVVRHIAYDESNRPIGRIGPVRAGYLCVQKGPKLVAIETESGRELWERVDLPKDVTILGDDHRVYIWSKNLVVEVLSSVDGRKLEQRVEQHPPANMFHHRGSLVWTKSGDKECKIELLDLASGESIWNRTEPAGTHVTAIDAETLAVATLDGKLDLLIARTGKSIGEPLLIASEKMNGLIAWSDSLRWYVAVGRPTGNLTKLKLEQLNGGFRQRFLSGQLYGIDRTTPKILWKRELLNEPILLDQSNVAPVLIQNWKIAGTGENSPHERVVRITDRRTGKMLVDPNRRQQDSRSYLLLNPDPQQGIVELKLPYKTILLNYASDAPADALEPIGQSRSDRPREE